MAAAAALCAILAVPAQNAARQVEEARNPGGGGFAGLDLIAARNIFDASRRSTWPRVAEAPKPERIETLTLVGTLTSEKGAFAFFDGSDALFQKVLETGGEIADGTVGVVGSSGVTLQTNGSSIRLRVGTQLRREGDGHWQVAAPSAVRPPPSAARQLQSGNDSDIAKRLMQKREQELK